MPGTIRTVIRRTLWVVINSAVFVVHSVEVQEYRQLYYLVFKTYITF